MTSKRIPTADDVALAIVMACRTYGDDPIEVARGGANTGSRELAYCALTLCFPLLPTKSIVRMIGGSGKFLVTFRKGWNRSQRRQAYSEQQEIANAIYARRDSVFDDDPEPFRLVESLHLRKPAVPVHRCENVNRDVLGDPAPGRSALDTRGNERRI